MLKSSKKRHCLVSVFIDLDDYLQKGQLINFEDMYKNKTEIEQNFAQAMLNKQFQGITAKQLMTMGEEVVSSSLIEHNAIQFLHDFFTFINKHYSHVMFDIQYLFSK